MAATKPGPFVRFPVLEDGLLLMVEDAYGDQSAWDVVLHVSGCPCWDSVRRFLVMRRINPDLVGEYDSRPVALRTARALSKQLNGSIGRLL